MSKADKKHVQSREKVKMRADENGVCVEKRTDGKYSILRYGLTILLVMTGFYGLYWSESLVEQRWFRPFTYGQAEIAKILLGMAGEDVNRIGNVLVRQIEGGKPYTLAVGLGCEAFDVTILTIVGILCFPAKRKHRLVGAILGGLLIQAVNLLRISSLYLVGLHMPQHFDFIHHNLWQVLLVLCVVCVWGVWNFRISPSQNLR